MKLDWKHLFDWTIDSVGGPAQSFKSNGQTAGYTLMVRYKYHGTDKYYFDAEDERLYTTFRSPEEAAKLCYADAVRRMNRQKARMAAGLARQKD